MFEDDFPCAMTPEEEREYYKMMIEDQEDMKERAKRVNLNINSIEIPFDLFTNEEFKDLSISAKVLYGLLLKLTLSSSKENDWINDDGFYFIKIRREECAEILRTFKKNYK